MHQRKSTALIGGCTHSVLSHTCARSFYWLHCSTRSVLCLLWAHRWCPQHYMGRVKEALIKGFDQKKTHHLPSSPPFCTQWIHGQNDADQVSYKNRRFAVNVYSKDTGEQEQKKKKKWALKKKKNHTVGRVLPLSCSQEEVLAPPSHIKEHTYSLNLLHWGKTFFLDVCFWKATFQHTTATYE